MNNVSFVLPRRTSLLQAYYQNIQGIYTTDFPPVPPVTFDYTGNVSRGLWQPRFGTKLYKLKFGSYVQIVLQDTAIVTTEDHPIHLHGYHFYVVGQGFGNFNPSRDTPKFNLIDPPLRNTINVPVGGWSVIRFVADNPEIPQVCLSKNENLQQTNPFLNAQLQAHQNAVEAKENQGGGDTVTLSDIDQFLFENFRSMYQTEYEEQISTKRNDLFLQGGLSGIFVTLAPVMIDPTEVLVAPGSTNLAKKKSSVVTFDLQVNLFTFAVVRLNFTHAQRNKSDVIS
ncbi:hypothetical protein DH2020_043173 [Rehmannia glutinosa]|uniref:Plastocyanin-like domain-containing protein n=1 Tax=Rehmannia glutinosa TaxID=99300 RepID=A0ABR0UM29_REHGL